SKPIEAGTYGENIWIAFASEDATPLGDVLLNLGRLDGNSVLEIARQLVGFLGELEAVEVYHGDISTLSVCLLDDGSIRLRYPGVSGILRPVVDALEDASHGDTNAARRSRVASDIYACGALWWQLLSGRLPLPAAASIGSLDGIAKKKLVDVRRYAPDAPAALVTAIDACLGGNSGQPAASLTALAKMLGPPSPTGRRVLKAVIAQLKCHSSASIATIARRVIRSKESAAWMATIAGCLAVIAGVSWPLWRSQSPPQPATEKTPAVASATKTTTSNAAGRAAAKPNQKLHADVQQAAFIGRPVDAEPLVLPNTMVEWNNVQRALRPGQLVRGAPGKRPSIVIPASGIVLAVEDIRFQGIDFIWRPAADAAFDPERLELFELCAAQATFRDCTLTAVADSTSGHPVAIRWTGPRQQRQLSPAGRLQIDGCLMRGVVAAIDCRCHSPLSISVSETLYLGPGPLVRMDRVPKIDEPLEVQLSRLTLRGAAAVVGIHIEQMPEDEPGSIVIVAHNCAFSPARGGSLVLFASAEFPGRLARSIQWSGEGSVLSAESPAAFWLPRGKNA
ncbi:MAG TPA: hypothetical protein VKB78_11800, partial [Pirellulales bacterium]|nr:hypothetical protein [Pirellulales bacterium]